MKYIKIFLIGLLLFSFMVAQDKGIEPVKLDQYETVLMERYDIVNMELQKLIIEKAKLEYAFNTYQANKSKEVTEVVSDKKKENNGN